MTDLSGKVRLDEFIKENSVTSIDRITTMTARHEDWSFNIDKTVELSTGAILYMVLDNKGIVHTFPEHQMGNWELFDEPFVVEAPPLPEILSVDDIGMPVRLRNGIVTVLMTYKKDELIRSDAPFMAYSNFYRSSGKISHSEDNVEHSEDIIEVL